MVVTAFIWSLDLPIIDSLFCFSVILEHSSQITGDQFSKKFRFFQQSS
jgi:hypothetical protein